MFEELRRKLAGALDLDSRLAYYAYGVHLHLQLKNSSVSDRCQRLEIAGLALRLCQN